MWNLYQASREGLQDAVKEGNYNRAFEMLRDFRTPVNKLFEEVEILTKEDERLKENRLGLLQAVKQLFLRVGDFSKFSI